ncbi:MAG: hypothetical protein HY721_11195 [Planctomycetes bacterium]|nr:hypothetical protein [Planctomycetota bacterium]
MSEIWDHEGLSDAGRARKEAMLRQLKAAVVARRRRRRAARWAAAMAIPAALLGTVVLVRGRPDRESPSTPPLVREDPAPAPARLDNLRFEVVRDDPMILERWRAEPRAADPAVFVSDDELLDLLAAARRPTGLVRVGEGAFLSDDLDRRGTPQ